MIPSATPEMVRIRFTAVKTVHIPVPTIAKQTALFKLIFASICSYGPIRKSA